MAPTTNTLDSTAGAGESDKSSGSDNTLYIIIGAAVLGAVALIVLIIVIVSVRRRKKSGESMWQVFWSDGEICQQRKFEIDVGMSEQLAISSAWQPH